MSAAQDALLPCEACAQPKPRLSRATKDILFGSVAGMISKLFEHPFDLVKVRLQTQPMKPAPHYTGALDCFRKTIQREGVRGLFRGVSMPLCGATLENASLFFTYNQVQPLLRDVFRVSKDEPAPMSLLAVAAACSGAVAGFVLTPVELIKCRMQVQMMTMHTAQADAPKDVRRALPQLPSALTLIRQTVREAGIRGLWLGFAGTLVREMGGGIAWFLTFEIATRELIQLHQHQHPSKLFAKKDLSSIDLAGSGALAGIMYNVSLFPADCVKSTMQTEKELRMHSKVPHAISRGFFATFAHIYKTRGIRGLYAGLGVTCLRSAPSSAIVFLVYNKLEHAADLYGL
ncbi:mitochondrial ornithine carrier protein [Malassezia vespertilionis]|uniref:Mitochondrial carrier n=1 Tax=Malassezia vespertilionis TaxID=2020962 RepID=A0A2N1JG40_9BASI|nr:mitochondrial ornithine carrier protein [Malassezia vespertilionis]PKI85508.1 hypothetical protein MVES_000451 [Malassezia vespertilionis]WFD05162.1 mitochondrial ornithine carrier protein [Malassezia vespertilionis]